MRNFNALTGQPLKYALVLLFCLQAGCARLTMMTSDDLVADIQAAIEAEDFRLAEFLGKQTPQSHAQYEQVQKQAARLERAMARFRQAKIEQADAYATARQWREAEAILDDAANHLPRHDEAISTAINRLQERQQKHYADHESRILLGQATWLRSQQQAIDRLPEYSLGDANRLHKRLQADRRNLAERLISLADAPCEAGSWQRCHDLLEAGYALAPDIEADTRLAKARQQLDSAASRKRARQQQQLRDQARELRQTYDRSGDLAHLLALRDFIRQHTESGALDREERETARLCLSRFEEGIKQGEALYARGEYEQALQRWRTIQPLFPNNSELEKKLTRVHRVLENLEKLNAQ